MAFLKKTIVIWLLFIISTKTYYIFTFIFIIFLFSLYVVDEYEVYLDENNIKKYHLCHSGKKNAFMKQQIIKTINDFSNNQIIIKEMYKNAYKYVNICINM